MKKLILLLLFIPLVFSCVSEEIFNNVEDQNWYKGNLHSHSLWSDGDDFPEMIIKWYKENDYNFLAISDHNVLADDKYFWYELNEHDIYNKTLEKYKNTFGDWVETKFENNQEIVRLKTFDEYKNKMEEKNSFILIKSEEVTANHFDREKNPIFPHLVPVHINVTNIQNLINPPIGKSVYEVMQKTIDAALLQRNKYNIPIFPHINHPNLRYGITVNDMKKLNGERFFEVYNGHPSSNNDGDDLNIDLETMWDIINIDYYNNNKPLIFGLATDDSHNYHFDSIKRSNPGRGWVMVNSKKLETNSLIEALESGDFYSSSGIEIKKLISDESKIYVEINPENNIDYEIIFIGYQNNSSHVSELKIVYDTSAEYNFTENDLFVRVKVNSNEIKTNPNVIGETTQAWTQPFLVK